jgi:Zn-dependent M16 (insulinase) family peptidase
MEKESTTTLRLKESIKEIKSDISKKASISFLARKYFVSRPTMTAFLIKEGIK